MKNTVTRAIAVAGEGGVGKTTIAALLIDELRKQGQGVLAIDGDPSANPHQALGMPLAATVGDVREEMLAMTKTGQFPAGIAKQLGLAVVCSYLLLTSRGQCTKLALLSSTETLCRYVA